MLSRDGGPAISILRTHHVHSQIRTINIEKGSGVMITLQRFARSRCRVSGLLGALGRQCSVLLRRVLAQHLMSPIVPPVQSARELPPCKGRV